MSGKENFHGQQYQLSVASHPAWPSYETNISTNDPSPLSQGPHSALSHSIPEAYLSLVPSASTETSSPAVTNCTHEPQPNQDPPESRRSGYTDGASQPQFSPPTALLNTNPEELSSPSVQHALLDENPISKQLGQCIVIAISVEQFRNAVLNEPHKSRRKPRGNRDATSRRPQNQNGSPQASKTPKSGLILCPCHGHEFTSPSHVITHLIRDEGFQRRYFGDGAASRVHKAANYIERSPSSSLPWCALCTRCYETFTTKESLKAHIELPPKCPCNQNHYSPQKKSEIIRVLHSGSAANNHWDETTPLNRDDAVEAPGADRTSWLPNAPNEYPMNEASGIENMSPHPVPYSTNLGIQMSHSRRLLTETHEPNLAPLDASGPGIEPFEPGENDPHHATRENDGLVNVGDIAWEEWNGAISYFPLL